MGGERCISHKSGHRLREHPLLQAQDLRERGPKGYHLLLGVLARPALQIHRHLGCGRTPVEQLQPQRDVHLQHPDAGQLLLHRPKAGGALQLGGGQILALGV